MNREKAICYLFMISKNNSPKSICKKFNIDETTINAFINESKSNQFKFEPSHVTLIIITTMKMDLEQIKKHLTQHHKKLVDGIMAKNTSNKTKAYAINHFHVLNKPKHWKLTIQKARPLKLDENAWLTELLDENKILKKYNERYNLKFIIGHITKTFALSIITRHKVFEYRSNDSHLDLVPNDRCITFIKSLQSKSNKKKPLRLQRKNKRQNQWSKNSNKIQKDKQSVADFINGLRFKTMQHINKNNINATKDEVCEEIFAYVQSVSGGHIQWNTFFNAKPIKGYHFYKRKAERKTLDDFFKTVGTKQQRKFCNS